MTDKIDTTQLEWLVSALQREAKKPIVEPAYEAAAEEWAYEQGFSDGVTSMAIRALKALGVKVDYE